MGVHRHPAETRVWPKQPARLLVQSRGDEFGFYGTTGHGGIDLDDLPESSVAQVSKLGVQVHVKVPNFFLGVAGRLV